VSVLELSMSRTCQLCIASHSSCARTYTPTEQLYALCGWLASSLLPCLAHSHARLYFCLQSDVLRALMSRVEALEDRMLELGVPPVRPATQRPRHAGLGPGWLAGTSTCAL
jgi:hypothetical protein